MADYDLPTEFVEKYIAFCHSPRRDRTAHINDLADLTSLPQVAYVTFAKVDNTLLIVTKVVMIRNPETTLVHRIGQFLICIKRVQKEWEWETHFSLINVDGTIAEKNSSICGDETLRYMHPHMMTVYSPELRCDVAKICISAGRFHIYRMIRYGIMSAATQLIIDLLHSLGPGAPYKLVSHWPVVTEGSPL